MEVVVRVPPVGDLFNLGGSPCSSHYLSAPSTPLISSLSAPTSPSHGFNFFRFDDDVPIASPSSVPFLWEEKPGTPKRSGDNVHDFEFDFTAHSFSIPSLPADELFHRGKIKPLKPPPGFQSTMSSPRSPHNSKFSPRKSKSGIDPFEAALMNQTLQISSETALHQDDEKSFSGTGAGAGKAKSSSFLSAISFSRPNRRWRLRDFLFRSATDKSHKFSPTYVAMDDDVNISSFRSADGAGSRLHYPAANRSVSEEFTKKKGLFPNKPGFLSRCLRFNRSGVPEISRGIGSLTRG